ncbi:uncharacterized protein B0H18DRAFT_1112834 [Fomitopsis serialis]|uniref:uncharacterized protein n=1 Tax=Fomitopsis serialis TaxID=139415 RepID=UPI0020076A8A|nr:uncharacterized protein B0H18DRAFT_1112834 [Neoantrodia serialis]KAH9938709.1 hypothetical protein B0H18DRAFT_1112834 [Neoantrodia serialis]
METYTLSASATSSGLRPQRPAYDQREHHRRIAEEPRHDPVNWDVIDYLIDCVVWTVSHACYDGETWLAPVLKTAFLCDFVQNLIRRSGVPMPVILTCLTYLERASSTMGPLPLNWACERTFLGAFLVAARGTIEYQYADAWWAHLTGVLSADDIEMIDRDFRQLINYNLQVHANDYSKHYRAIMERCERKTSYWSKPPFMEERRLDPRYASPIGHLDARPSRSSSRSSASLHCGCVGALCTGRCSTTESRWDTSSTYLGRRASPPVEQDHYLDAANAAPDLRLPPLRYPEVPDAQRLPPIRDLLPPHINDLLPPGPGGTPPVLQVAYVNAHQGIADALSAGSRTSGEQSDLVPKIDPPPSSFPWAITF